jgi:DNA modification methylase
LVLAKTPKYYWNGEAKTPAMKAPGSDLYQQERGIDCSNRTMKNNRDVWPIPRCGNRTLKHPARFSEELARRVLRLMCPPSGHVLDLWGGSGTTAVAALQLGLDCTSVELNPDYILEQQVRLAAIPQARKWLRPLITPHGRMIHGDALTEVRKLATGEIGFILFDPPSANGATALSWDEDLDWDAIFEELWRVVKIDGFIAINCNDRLFARLVEMQGPLPLRHSLVPTAGYKYNAGPLSAYATP